jgi:Coenzyme PQQ synthesis protein D (PqqD)
VSSGDPKPGPDAELPLKLAEESLTWREVDEEIVVLDRRTWMYMGVNGSGVLLWKEIVEGAPSRSRLVECLCEAYEIDAEVARRDVEAFIEMLSSNSLLIEDGAG